jgi:DNA-binding NtrC family response regulator
LAQRVQSKHMNKTWRILLVEDDPSLGPATLGALRDAGDDCELAASVADGFRVLSNANDFDVILLDLHLGSERGELLIQQLYGARLRVPAVFIFSAQPEWDIRQAMDRTHAKGSIQKPATVMEIHRALESAIET